MLDTFLKAIVILTIFTFKVLSYPFPNTYTEQATLIVENSTFYNTKYSPDQNLIIYRTYENSCFRVRQVLVANYSQQICNIRINQMEFSPKGDLFVIGTYDHQILVFKVDAQGLVSKNPLYTYTTELLKDAVLCRIAISKQNRIAIGIFKTLFVLTIPSTGIILQLQSTFQFASAQQILALKFHPKDLSTLFVGTVADEDSNAGLYIYFCITKQIKKISAKSCRGIAVLNSGNILLASIYSITDSYSNIDAYSYYQGGLAYIGIAQQGQIPPIMMVSSDDRILATAPSQQKIKIYKINGATSTNQSISNHILTAISLESFYYVQAAYESAFSSDGNQILFHFYEVQGLIKRFSLCPDSTYLSNQQCLPCSQPCVTCHKSASQCRSCQKSSCLFNQQCLTCSATITGCLKCFSPSICTSCDYASRFSITPVNGKCVCAYEHMIVRPNQSYCVCDQFYFQSSDPLCKLCDSDRNCKVCKNQQFCISCNVEKNWEEYATEGMCICRQGFKKNGNECVKCSVIGCNVCKIEDNCSQCSSEQGFKPDPLQNNTCSCTDHTYFDTQSLSCKPCSILTGCLSCISQAICTQCDYVSRFSTTPVNGKCVCAYEHMMVKPNSSYCVCNQFYFQSSDRVCKSCSILTGCLRCTSQTICTQCLSSSNFQLNNKTHRCQCMSNYFLQNSTSQCYKCEHFFVHCSSCFMTYPDVQVLCKVCQDGFTLSTDFTKCQCLQQKGFEIVDGKCVEKKDDGGKDSGQWIMYVAIVAAAIGVIGGGFLIYRCRKRNLKGKNNLLEEKNDANPYFLQHEKLSDAQKIEKGLISSSLLSN